MNGNMVFGNLPVISDSSYLPKQILGFHDETALTKVHLPFLGQSLTESMHVQTRFGNSDDDDDGLTSPDASIRAKAYTREWYIRSLPYWWYTMTGVEGASAVNRCYNYAPIAGVVQAHMETVLRGEW
eukprot:CAMPEP_0194262054 /NCGR_PEP_ID=MMETSP0158-20130606/46348_1 /TAXON_ID=33649 /ORGANISM="Thalassionema nitzschioides, Strain L26-B" /LENGTH=126 /DNA_ID=CAMNT_0039002197 /DNA_START=139 /DNA_END=516 /DNA_ORIENTATION=+